MRPQFKRCLARAFQTVADHRADSIHLRLQHLETRLAPATILVNTTLDNTATDGKVSLREALTSANNNADLNPDVTAFRMGAYGTEDINFDVAVFGVPQQISLLTALPNITGNVNFKGTSAANVTVARTAPAPSFGLFNCAITGIGNVSFSNMTMTGGGGTTIGAAINAGNDNLTVTSCVLTNNNAIAPGGGIGVGTGGSTITVSNTLFSLNSGNLGGAIFFTNTGNLVMDNCTMTGNKATGANGGGAIHNDSNTATIRNSTFNGNMATAGRGGALTLQAAANVTLQNCTVAGNSATGTGGGIHRQAGVLTLDSTIVAKNFGAGGTDILGAVAANFCLIGVSNDGPVIVGANNQLGTNLAPLDPMLLPLAFNGGPTPTRALMPGSPCINVGSNPGGLPTDQRGPGFFRVIGGLPDIGAYEEQKLIVLNKNDAGVGSLRQAIDDANKIIQPQDIVFDASFFSTPQTIILTTGELKITSPVSIIGPQERVTISGNNASRIFNIDGPGILMVNLSGLTIKDGNAGTSKGGGIRIGDEVVKLFDVFRVENCTAADGGGIALDGTGAKLECQDGSVRFCAATNAAGGGGAISSLGVANGCITFLNSTVSDNKSAGHGGGIAMSSGMLEITRCNVSANKAGLDGGGIRCFGTDWKVRESTLANNMAGGHGGGITIAGNSPGDYDGLVLNSTLSGNKASGNGGGIALAGSGVGDTVTLQNCTITNNQAETLAGGIFGGPRIIDIESSIIAGNINSAAPDISSDVAGRLKWSALGSKTGFGYSDLGGNLPLGINLKLGPLADNGGPTMTHALLPFSPALQKGSNPNGLTTDQRGPGYVRVAGGAPDMGAYENQTITPAAKVVSVVINDGEVQRSKVREICISFDQIVEPQDLPNVFQLKRHSDDAMVLLNGVMGPNTMSVTLTFVGGAVDGTSLADGRYDLSIMASLLLNASGLPLDGNGDGMPGGDYILIGNTTTNKLFRLFGDDNADGSVTATDFNAFRLVYGSSGLSAFDFNNDGTVTATDFNQFRTRYGVMI